MSKRIHAYRRTAPIEVDLNARIIQFYLLDNKAVVADVDHKEDADRLLAIPEAYREYKPAAIAANGTGTVSTATPGDIQRQAELLKANGMNAGTEATDMLKRAAGSETLRGSNLQPDVIDLTGSKTATLAEVVAYAFQNAVDGEGTALTITDWNGLEDADREARIAEAINELEEAAEKAEEKAADELRVQIAADAKRAADARAKGQETAPTTGTAGNAVTGGAVDSQEAKAASLKYTLKNGDTVIDLKAMDDKKLREFAKTYQVALPAGLKGDQIRQHIVDALAPESEGK